MQKLKSKVKNAWKSFTIWWNASGVILLEALVTMPELQEYLSTEGMFKIWILGNVILRVFKTAQAIEDK